MLNTDTPIEEVTTEFTQMHNISLFVKRDDQIHPFISGNKWRKLKYNLTPENVQDKVGVVTFGGAYSNHLVATACAAALRGIPCRGIVRGEELNSRSNFILRLCAEFGMKLEFVTREQYTQKETLYEDWKAQGFFVIPEGGDNRVGAKGCEEIVPQESFFDHVIVAVGTGTTMTGILNSVTQGTRVHGIAALKGAEYLKDRIAENTQHSNWILHTQYAGGGFGKFSEEQLRFNQKFTSETGVLLDPIYTGKMMSALYALVENKSIEKGSRVLAIHTGGLTGVLTDKWRLG